MNDKPAMANTQAFAVITQDELSSLRAELAELRARVAVPDDVAKDALERIAAIVHNGGLARISEWDAICAVRRLSLPWWNSDGTLNELRDRAYAAILSATDSEVKK